jgi:hypothetical protein
MSLALAGLHNVGDFYSQHYLETLLAGDLKAVLEEWKQAEKNGGAKTPAKRLAALQDLYFRTASRAASERSPARRFALAQELHAPLLELLGYDREPGVEEILSASDDKAALVPVVARVEVGRKPLLWVVEAPFPQDLDEAAPLDEAPLSAQLPPAEREALEAEGDAAATPLAQGTWAELLDGALLRGQHAPRWVLLMAGSELLLIDGHKWPQGKYLRFDLGTLLSRREPQVLDAVTGLLHRRVLVPEAGGQSLLDQIDDKSHKHAFAVSTDLKRGVQEAIEALANEVLYDRRTRQKQGVFGDPELADALTRECITYLYRLLFLFYVEARSDEAGVVEMKSDAYRTGYSLESLRDLEQAPLHTHEAQEGTFLQESLEKLFRIVQHGYGPRQLTLRPSQAPGVSANERPTLSAGFVMQGMRSQLFDPERTPILRASRLRNIALQKVLRLLSLSEEKRGQQRGRISYAQLGINQLGAVYEGLLSYRGFFASEDCLEIQVGGSSQKEEGQTYFIPASRRAEFAAELFVTDAQGRQTLYPKGTYLFRMAGRDREKSASYYTPQVLTECLTRYTLKERLGEPGTPEALSADEILQLTVCEPAMGSGAFMNEAIDQLAEAYLSRKQAERLEAWKAKQFDSDEAREEARRAATVPAERYALEKQRVKLHFAVHNSYGVDLNPLATELGKVSLWLACLHPGAAAPYLNLHIATGNSLIGARRRVFRTADLTRKGDDNWLSREPEAVGWEAGARPEDGIYHFLVPDQGMAPFDDDKVLKALSPDETKAIKAWRKAFCAPFTQDEVKRLSPLSARVDVLWQRHLEQRREALESTRRRLRLWGQPEPEGPPRPEDAQTFEEQVRAILARDEAGQRLEQVMDAWCALWFWPVAEAHRLPSRAEWLGDLEALLAPAGERKPLDAGRMQVVKQVKARQRFFHWELSFAEAFADRGGMDIILGNPPWRKVEWEERQVLKDFDASLAVKDLNAKKWADARAGLLKDEDARAVFFGEAEEAAGTQAFLNAVQSYPLLRGVQTNLYKCFMTRAWELGSVEGIVGLLHQPAVFDDASGGRLRSRLACRLSVTARFQNVLRLFPEIGHKKQYAFSCTRCHPAAVPKFSLIGNLFHPHTLDESLEHDGVGPVPGIKTDDGTWDLRGHRSRVVPVDEATLALFAQLYDKPETPALEARLPVVHSREILSVLRRFAEAPRRLSHLEGQYFATVCFDETGRQADGTIRRETRFPKDASEWVVSGPHFYVGTPLNKTPRAVCTEKGHYDPLDLTQIPDDYLPRTNYVSACSQADYRDRTPHWQGRPITDFYRFANRRRVDASGERTLLACVIPPGPAHVDLVFSVVLPSSRVVELAGVAAGLPADFFVKSTGKGDVRNELLAQLALPDDGPARDALVRRSLRLNCLTTHYAPLWEELFDPAFTHDSPTTADLRAGRYDGLTLTWERDTPLRTPFARRQALCEIDALAALSLGMTVDELLLIYRVQFPVLQQYERETYYDRRGKVVFTTNSQGLNGVGVTRAQWNEIRDAQAGDVLPEWARDQGGPFEPPFDCPDREADMAQAYRVFAERFGLGGARDDSSAASQPEPGVRA